MERAKEFDNLEYNAFHVMLLFWIVWLGAELRGCMHVLLAVRANNDEFYCCLHLSIRLIST